MEKTMGTGIIYFPFRQRRENNGDADHLFRVSATQGKQWGRGSFISPVLEFSFQPHDGSKKVEVIRTAGMEPKGTRNIFKKTMGTRIIYFPSVGVLLSAARWVEES